LHDDERQDKGSSKEEGTHTFELGALFGLTVHRHPLLVFKNATPKQFPSLVRCATILMR
jgi:hypothetical protein